VQEITKNEITGALDANLTINHAVFDEQTWQNLIDLPENAVKAADHARVSAHLLGEFVALELTDNLYKNWDDPTSILNEAVADFNRGDKQNQLYQTTKSKDSVRLMWKFDSDKSVTDNVQDILDSSSSLLDDNTKQKLLTMLSRGVDDNVLLGSLVSPLYKELIQSGDYNPVHSIADSFGLTLGQREYLATVTNIQRGVDSAGDGSFGAPRGNRGHLGLDLSADYGDYAYAPIAGTVTDLNAPYPTNNGNLQIVTITSEAGTSRSFYISPREEITIGSDVKQGDYIGTVQNLRVESPLRHGGVNPTPNHAHQEIIINGEHQNPASYIYK
jgi:hypothetical protein